MNNNRCVVCSEVIPEGKQVCEACREGNQVAIEHNGYKIIQDTNNHIQIYKNGQIVFYASGTKKMTENELRQQVDLMKKIRESKYES